MHSDFVIQVRLTLGEGEVEQHSSLLLKIALFSVILFSLYLLQRFLICRAWLAELLAELLNHEKFSIAPCELLKLIGALNGFRCS